MGGWPCPARRVQKRSGLTLHRRCSGGELKLEDRPLAARPGPALVSQHGPRLRFQVRPLIRWGGTAASQLFQYIQQSALSGDVM